MIYLALMEQADQPFYLLCYPNWTSVNPHGFWMVTFVQLAYWLWQLMT